MCGTPLKVHYEDCYGKTLALLNLLQFYELLWCDGECQSWDQET